jgi:hypothetical protein
MSPHEPADLGVGHMWWLQRAGAPANRVGNLMIFVR